MKQLITLTLVILISAKLQAQTVISGKITNTRKETVSAASVIIKETGTGADADSTGYYKLITNEKGKRTIVVSSVGYNSKEITVNIADAPIQLDIVLKDEPKQLGEVVVSAGTFEASDKAKGASLTPMDAVTVAGSGADLATSLRSLPGAQQIGEEEGLFVRGGTNAEAKQFIDGTLLKNPNSSSVPGILQQRRDARGEFGVFAEPRRGTFNQIKLRRDERYCGTHLLPRAVIGNAPLAVFEIGGVVPY